MAVHSSNQAEKSGGLPSLGSERVRHDYSYPQKPVRKQAQVLRMRLGMF